MPTSCDSSSVNVAQELKGSESLSKATEQLLWYLKSSSIVISPENASQAVKHLASMLKKNEVLNLTAIRDFDEALILHTYDSLLFVDVMRRLGASSHKDDTAAAQSDVHNSAEERATHQTFNESQGVESLSGSRVLDMGTGGGFPGIPVACSTEAEVTLLDSVGKKISACNEFVVELNLGARVHGVHSRLEDFAKFKAERGSYDFVLARALASLDVLLEYATPLCRMGGFVVLSKGTPDAEELAHAEVTADICGIRLVSRETFELPENHGHREFYVYQKVRPSRVKLPRKNGEARKNPLAGLR